MNIKKISWRGFVKFFSAMIIILKCCSVQSAWSLSKRKIEMGL